MRSHGAMLASLALAGALFAGCAQRGDENSARVPTPPVTDVEAQREDARGESNLSADVIDVDWQWVGFTTPVEQIEVDAPERYTIRFEKGGAAAVRADCNRGRGTYTSEADRRIAFGPIALTRMACPRGSLADRFTKELARATSFFVRDGELFLELPVDSGTLRFRRSGS